MTPALTPELALEYLRELSADVRDGVVLDPAGALLAGEPALLEPARAALAELGDAAEGRAVAPEGVAVAARGERHAIVLVLGPRALPGLAAHDVGLVLGDLGDGPARGGSGGVGRLTPAGAQALFSAAQRGPGD